MTVRKTGRGQVRAASKKSKRKPNEIIMPPAEVLAHKHNCKEPLSEIWLCIQRGHCVCACGHIRKNDKLGVPLGAWMEP